MENLVHHIAKTLKTLRAQRSWSLDRASQETGVSKAMLGQIEREESSPTITTLWKIASGFDVSFSSFISEQDASQLQSSAIEVRSLLSYTKDMRLDIFLIKLLPCSTHISAAHQKSVVEKVLVIRGEVDVMINGHWQSVLESIEFPGDQPHGYRNPGKEHAVFLNIIQYER